MVAIFGGAAVAMLLVYLVLAIRKYLAQKQQTSEE